MAGEREHAGSASATDRHQVVLAPCAMHALADGAVLVVRERTGTRARMPAHHARALALCVTMQPLEDHAAAIVAHDPVHFSDVTEARSVVAAADDAGLLVSSLDVGRALAPRGSAPAPPTDPMVCTITCDRPAMLRRALVSILGTVAAPDVAARGHVVVDDSRSATSVRRNRAVCAETADRYGIPIAYLGPPEQRAIVASLCHAAPAHRAEIAFLLAADADGDRVSPGRALDFALLLAHGRTLVCVDDDVVCHALAPPLPVVDEIHLGSHPRQAAFHAGDRQRAGARPTSDPIARLAGSLGHDLATAADHLRRGTGATVRLDGMASAAAQALVDGTGRVAVATCGLDGDPGTASAAWMFELDDASRRRLVDDEARYRAALRRRDVWLGTLAHRLSRRHGMLSPLKALDHRRALPPFFPRLRGEDYLLGRLLPLADPDAWVLEHPWAVVHRPAPPRRWPADLLDRPVGLSFARFTAWLWERRLALPPATPAQPRLALLGAGIRDLGDTDAAGIHEALEICLLEERTRTVRRLEAQLDEATELPTWYRRDLDRLIVATVGAIDAGLPARLADVDAHSGRDDATDWVRRAWRHYGAAVMAWPDILAAADACAVHAAVTRRAGRC
ncbi:MAG: hypothetical protein H6983_05510 [Ectothiorhodospiraceae bacterium]|nr:hypothetical protein [Chromatiales bacterium]MCP5153599.1 hypothetical protein [Ectothiorhodospiraceae bacterium]